MPTNVFYPHAIVLPTAPTAYDPLTQMKELDWDWGIEDIAEMGASEVAPSFLGAMTNRPTMPLESTQLRTLFQLLSGNYAGTTSTSAGSETDGIVFEMLKGDNLKDRKPIGDLEHIRYAAHSLDVHA